MHVHARIQERRRALADDFATKENKKMDKQQAINNLVFNVERIEMGVNEITPLKNFRIIRKKSKEKELNAFYFTFIGSYTDVQGFTFDVDKELRISTQHDASFYGMQFVLDDIIMSRLTERGYRYRCFCQIAEEMKEHLLKGFKALQFLI